MTAPVVEAGKMRVDRVSVVFARGGDTIQVLQDIDLEVRAGEFLCLIGPSGCGKSTLLNAMAGFLAPTSGSVTVDGKTVTGPDPRRVLVFQERGVFPWLTVEGNIGFGLERSAAPGTQPTNCALHRDGAIERI